MVLPKGGLIILLNGSAEFPSFGNTFHVVRHANIFIMTSQYLFEKKENYLLLIISGAYDKEDFMAYPTLISEECKKEKIDKVLVNGLSLSGTNVPTMDRFFVAENIANILGPKVKIAVVWPKEHINKFAETVAVNRGSLIKVVDSIEAAQNWLLGNP